MNILNILDTVNTSILTKILSHLSAEEFINFGSTSKTQYTQAKSVLPTLAENLVAEYEIKGTLNHIQFYFAINKPFKQYLGGRTNKMDKILETGDLKLIRQFFLSNTKYAKRNMQYFLAMCYFLELSEDQIKKRLPDFYLNADDWTNECAYVATFYRENFPDPKKITQKLNHIGIKNKFLTAWCRLTRENLPKKLKTDDVETLLIFSIATNHPHWVKKVVQYGFMNINWDELDWYYICKLCISLTVRGNGTCRVPSIAELLKYDLCSMIDIEAELEEVEYV